MQQLQCRNLDIHAQRIVKIGNETFAFNDLRYPQRLNLDILHRSIRGDSCQSRLRNHVYIAQRTWPSRPFSSRMMIKPCSHMSQSNVSQSSKNLSECEEVCMRPCLPLKMHSRISQRKLEVWSRKLFKAIEFSLSSSRYSVVQKICVASSER